MSAQPVRFAELVEMIDRLSLEDRESLMEIFRRRNSEDARRRIAASVGLAKREHRIGKSKPTSADELMREILG